MKVGVLTCTGASCTCSASLERKLPSTCSSLYSLRGKKTPTTTALLDLSSWPVIAVCRRECQVTPINSCHPAQHFGPLTVVPFQYLGFKGTFWLLDSGYGAEIDVISVPKAWKKVSKWEHSVAQQAKNTGLEAAFLYPLRQNHYSCHIAYMDLNHKR